MDDPQITPGGSTSAATSEGGAALPGGGGAPTSWLTDESLRGHPSLSRYKDPDSLGRAYVELEKKLGERPQGIKPLSAESTPEEVATYRAAMGIPEAPEKYELGELAFPEEATPTQEQIAGWMQTFHDANLTQAQVQIIMQRYASETSGQWSSIREAQEAQGREGHATLTKKYGSQAPAMITMAHEYVKRRYGPEGIEALGFGPGATSALGNNPVLIEILAESAKLTGHDKFVLGDNRGGLLSQETAKQKYDELWAKRAQAKDESERAAIDQEINRVTPLAFG